MHPCCSVGFGGRLHLIEGAKTRTVNLTFTTDIAAADPDSPHGAIITIGAGSENWLEAIYGGNCSNMPCGYANQKAGAWYYGKFYYGANKIEDTADFYILSWDGSGIFKHGGFIGTDGYGANWRNGRGTELVSPSGSHNITMQSCAHIIHNGVLFIIGASPLFTTSAGNDPWRTKEDWDVASVTNVGDSATRRRRRKYSVFGIDKKNKIGKDHKFITTPVEFSGLANGQEDTNSCDAISFNNDIFYANYCDVLKFPGGSGIPQLIEFTQTMPAAKCFEIYPSGGFDVDNNPVFDIKTQKPDLLFLNSSGVIKSINFVNGVASGTTVLFDLGSIVTDFDSGDIDVRSSKPLSRVLDDTLEPPRSCYLKSFNNQLHAFIASATSGYHYFRCDGDARDSNNWQNASKSLPDDFKRFDGDLYGFHDIFRNALYLLHVSKSEYGIWGFVGGQKSAGGMTLNELNTDFNFREIYRGMSAEPSIGLIPYNPLGPYVQVASGNNPEVLPSTDYALVSYKLFSTYPAICNVSIQYSIDNGITWHKAKRFKSYINGSYLGDGLTGLSSSFFGESHTFYWSHIADLGCNTNDFAKIRIIVEFLR